MLRTTPVMTMFFPLISRRDLGDGLLFGPWRGPDNTENGRRAEEDAFGLEYLYDSTLRSEQILENVRSIVVAEDCSNGRAMCECLLSSVAKPENLHVPDL